MQDTLTGWFIAACIISVALAVAFWYAFRIVSRMSEMCRDEMETRRREAEAYLRKAEASKLKAELGMEDAKAKLQKNVEEKCRGEKVH